MPATGAFLPGQIPAEFYLLVPTNSEIQFLLQYTAIQQSQRLLLLEFKFELTRVFRTLVG